MRSFRREGDSSVSCPDKNLTDPGHRALKRISVIDTHTGGEPTRVVIAGGPELGNGSMAERLAVFRDRHDAFRSAVVNEPRGSDVMVGAILLPAGRSRMRRRGDLFQQRRLSRHVRPRHHRRGRGAGASRPHRPRRPSHRDARRTGHRHPRRPEYRHHRQCRELSPGQGTRRSTCPGWGHTPATSPGAATGSSSSTSTAKTSSVANVERLTDVTWRIRQALIASGITGAGGAEIDHIELFGPPTVPGADSKNFVLCPGRAYDRSPCGTGTSAKIACLVADGKLAEGAVWRQESDHRQRVRRLGR